MFFNYNVESRHQFIVGNLGGHPYFRRGKKWGKKCRGQYPASGY